MLQKPKGITFSKYLRRKQIKLSLGPPLSIKNLSDRSSTKKKFGKCCLQEKLRPKLGTLCLELGCINIK